MIIRAPSKIEHELVELKAKVEDLDVVREKLTRLGAQYIGTFQQIDVYFDVPEGRLKLREVEGNDQAELIYYQRENIAEPKRSNVFILKVQEPAILKTLLGRLLKTRTTVEKVREIYRYQGTQIHLDMVKNLGTFLEFEREISADAQVIRKNRQVLRKLMEKLSIGSESLEELSYSDLIQM
ncbi:MAG: class IV adenylate cyclase [Candidatus Bathyarchaeaceae archaeon]